eukprot:96343_1
MPNGGGSITPHHCITIGCPPLNIVLSHVPLQVYLDTGMSGIVMRDIRIPFFCNNPTIANPTPSPTQTPTTLPDMPVNNTAQYTSDMNYIRGWMGVTTWLEANEYCRSQYGTSLATITSAKENTEITYSSGLQYTTGATPTTCSFIGLHRMHSMIDWDWIDGTGLNYTHWASGNTSSDTKLCSFMCGYGTWYTTSCTE